MFLILISIFALFTGLLVLFSASILYHLKHYTLPGSPAPRIIIGLYLSLSGFLWILGLYFLLQLRA